MRATDLVEKGVLDLVDMVLDLQRRNLELERRNMELERHLSRAMCGNLMNPTMSCQLPRGHLSAHYWSSPDQGIIVRW